MTDLEWDGSTGAQCPRCGSMAPHSHIGWETGAKVVDRFLAHQRAQRGEPMPAPHERHLAHVKRCVAARLDAKYRRGQRAHGGNLWDKSALVLVEDALDEAIDLAAYLETLKAQLEHKGGLK